MNQVDEYLATLPEWQRANLTTFRTLIHSIEPSATEDWKWNVPVFYVNNTMYFAMSAFKAHTKYNFILNGALIDDPKQLFNNGLESKKSRGIDLKEGEMVNQADLTELIKRSLGQ